MVIGQINGHRGHDIKISMSLEAQGHQPTLQRQARVNTPREEQRPQPVLRRFGRTSEHYPDQAARHRNIRGFGRTQVHRGRINRGTQGRRTRRRDRQSQSLRGIKGGDTHEEAAQPTTMDGRELLEQQGPAGYTPGF